MKLGYYSEYADNTTLCVKSNNVEDLQINAFIDVNTSITVNKFYPTVTIDSNPIENTTITKIIGVHIDQGAISKLIKFVQR